MSTELPDDNPPQSTAEETAGASDVVVNATPAHEAPDRDALGDLLTDLDSSDATGVLSDWATSSESEKRVAAARALSGGLSVVGVLTALEVLAADDHPEVRQAVAEAAAARLPDLPMRLLPVLERLAQDGRCSVRLHALDGLRQAVALGFVRYSLFDVLAGRPRDLRRGRRGAEGPERRTPLAGLGDIPE